VIGERGLKQRVEDADDTLFRLIAGWHSPVGDRLLPPLSEAASYSRLWAGAGVLIAMFGGKRGRLAVAEAAIAVGITSALANIAVKRIARRERPSSSVPPARRLEHPKSTSFPSGHAASAAAFSAVVGGRIPEIWLPVNATAATVGFSRIYTGVHYPGDVVVGWSIGRAVAAAVMHIASRLKNR
jgi:membrane-associated phospholipid phosphatase